MQLTKNANKAMGMLKTMSELGISISIENHINMVVDACLRSGKINLIDEILSEYFS